MKYDSLSIYARDYGDPLADQALHAVTGYYDGMGYLLYKQLIGIETIDYVISGSSIAVWEKVQPVV
jgi:hypothetical protein